MDFVVPADYGVKLKEIEKKDKYLDLARELKKKLLYRNATVIPIMIDAFSAITKWLVLGLEDLKQEEELRPSKLQL